MLKYISLMMIILILFAGCTEKPKITEKPKMPNPTFDVSPSATTVPEGVDAKFTINIPKAPYGFDPVFEIIPVRPEDSKVLIINDNQLKQIGHLDINNTVSKEISISGRVVYGDIGAYPIRIRLIVNNEPKEEKIIHLNVTH